VTAHDEGRCLREKLRKKDEKQSAGHSSLTRMWLDRKNGWGFRGRIRVWPKSEAFGTWKSNCPKEKKKKKNAPIEHTQGATLFALKRRLGNTGGGANLSQKNEKNRDNLWSALFEGEGATKCNRGAGGGGKIKKGRSCQENCGRGRFLSKGQ